MNRKGQASSVTLIVIGALAIVAIVCGILIFAVKVPSGQVPTTGASVEVNSLPNPDGYVMDQANILSPDVKSRLETDLKAFDGKAQIAVLTIKTTGDLSIEEYGIKLAEKWAPGYEGRDNGIILIVAIEDRKVRIEVGRGLEGDLTDTQANDILTNSVIPYFKNGDWNGGIVAGVDAIIKIINK